MSTIYVPIYSLYPHLLLKDYLQFVKVKGVFFTFLGILWQWNQTSHASINIPGVHDFLGGAEPFNTMRKYSEIFLLVTSRQMISNHLLFPAAIVWIVSFKATKLLKKKRKKRTC